MTARTSGRQYPLVLTLDLDYTTLTLADVVAQLPPNAVIVQAESIVDVASDDSGVATMDVDVGSEAIITVQNIKSLGDVESYTPAFPVHTVADDVKVSLAVGNEDATVGSGRVNIHYIVAGRANEVGEPGVA